MTFIEADAEDEQTVQHYTADANGSEDEVVEEDDSYDFPIDAHDHTIVCLELHSEHDLLSSEIWTTAAKSIAASVGFDGLLYSRDLDHERRFIAVIRWRSGTPTELQIEATRAAFGKLSDVAAEPIIHQIVMGSALEATGRESEIEIYIMQGDKAVIKPDLLRYVHDLATACLPQLGEDLPEELSWVTYGVNPLRSDDVQIISFTLSYVARTGDERSRFQDPEQATFPRGDRYQSLIAKPIQRWIQHGAVLYKYAVRLQLWRPGQSDDH